MDQVFLSDIELYYFPSPIKNNFLIIEGDEVHHLKDVMRHSVGDEIYITDGCGNIYKTIIDTLTKKSARCVIQEKKSYQNKYSNITFCIPRLKNNDRFEFALEKCVELGITNFIVFESQRTIAKGDKTDKWQKFLISAMKQSLRAWLPAISYSQAIKKILNEEICPIVFEQNTEIVFADIVSEIKQDTSKKYLLFFGPEGGFTEEELNLFEKLNRVRLTENRLRSESAIITAAALLSAS